MMMMDQLNTLSQIEAIKVQRSILCMHEQLLLG